MRIIKLFFYLCIPFIISCKEKNASGSPTTPAGPPPAMAVQTMVATIQSLSSQVEIPGSILANEETEIHPEVAGRIISHHLNEGAYVSSGTLLAKLNDGDLQAQINKLDIQLKIAEQTEKRQAELLKIQGISQQDYDLSLLNVQSLRADKDIVREEIRKTEIRAPFSGKLGLRNVSPGAYVTPSSILTTISQTDQLKIEFNVPERYSSELKNGMLIHFTVDGNPEVFTASITATQTSIEENTRSLKVRAQVKASKQKLTPGTFAKVKMVLGTNHEALMVPNTVIVPQGRKKLIYLYKGGKAMPADVATGVRDSTNIQILDGLKIGDTVITSGILFLRPGMDVKLKAL